MYYCLEGSVTSLQLDTEKSPSFGQYFDTKLNSINNESCMFHMELQQVFIFKKMQN